MIADRLTEVRSRIAAAARSTGRDPSSVRLIAVSKTVSIDLIRDAWLAGQRDFGENRVQEALQKIATSADLEIRWHLLGHLQTNKARKAAAAFAAIQSVDSVELLQKVDQAAGDAGRRPELLIQVDLAGETTKYGAGPGDVPKLLEAAGRMQAAQVVGLMTLPPLAAVPEDARPWFRRLRDLRDEWLAAGVPASMLRELSMGMSGDFEVAIEEGATMVRIGTSIFWSRHGNDDDVRDVVETEETRHFAGIERNLGVSPIDLRQRTFGTSMRGYDRQEVTSFLSEAAADFEGVLRENDRLRQDIVRLKTSLTQFRELEGSLKSMLISAQKIADDMKENAAQESARIVAEAQARAELAAQKAQARLEATQREVDGLKMKRREVETSIEATISTLRTTLDFVREQDRRERGADTNVVLHRPHVVHSA